jgi:tRNA (adenine37-N6)-methyltransferase
MIFLANMVTALYEIDILDGTPVLDIKPYITSFDEIASEKNEWYEKGIDHTKTLSDRRFM